MADSISHPIIAHLKSFIHCSVQTRLLGLHYLHVKGECGRALLQALEVLGLGLHRLTQVLVLPFDRVDDILLRKIVRPIGFFVGVNNFFLDFVATF